MRIFKWPLLLASLLLLISCTSEKVILDNFDHDAWKNDRNACGNQRSRYADALAAQKEKLLGFNELEMVETLGKPDQQEIYKRNEKFYYYFIDPSSKCDGESANPRRLIIRFNAVGLSKEVNIE